MSIPFPHCHDCHRPYGVAYGFPDLIVSHHVWATISPSSDNGGLLCPSCMCKRAHDAGVEATAQFRSGPFFKEGPPFTAGLAELRAEIERLRSINRETWQAKRDCLNDELTL